MRRRRGGGAPAGRYPVLQTMALLSGATNTPYRYPPPNTTSQYTVCNKNLYARHSQKKLYQFNIQCVTKYQFNIQCLKKVFVQDIHKKISPQKWYLLNLKIKTSVVLFYRAGRYASLQ